LSLPQLTPDPLATVGDLCLVPLAVARCVGALAATFTAIITIAGTIGPIPFALRSRTRATRAEAWEARKSAAKSGESTEAAARSARAASRRATFRSAFWATFWPSFGTTFWTVTPSATFRWRAATLAFRRTTTIPVARASFTPLAVARTFLTTSFLTTIVITIAAFRCAAGTRATHVTERRSLAAETGATESRLAKASSKARSAKTRATHGRTWTAGITALAAQFAQFSQHLIELAIELGNL
jgi:hypothetical protein